MKINGISQTKAINIYNEHKKNMDRSEAKPKGDSIEISSLGKSLSTYSVQSDFVNSKDKIEGIAQEVSNGIYNRDSKLIAEKIMKKIQNRI